MALALIARLALYVSVAPASDVYYYLTQAIQAMLAGMDPYGHAFLGIPPLLATPGAEHVLAYFPATLLSVVPFYVAGDVRLGFIAADLVVGACLYLIGGRRRLEVSLLYLFIPVTMVFSTFFLNSSLFGMAFIALFLLLESRGNQRAGAVAFGLALASSQFCLLLAPLVLVYYLKRGRWKDPILAFASAGLVVLPFLIASPSLLIGDTISFEFSRPLAPLFVVGGSFGFSVNPSLSSVVESLSGRSVPLLAKVLVEIAAVAPLLRPRDLPTLSRNGALFVLVSAFVLPNDFFWAYLELPFMLFLVWLSSR